MREVFGVSLFDYPADALIVPVNWTTRRDGTAVMGAGVAKQAAERWPRLSKWLGAIIAESEPHVHAVQFGGEPPWVVCLPTKRHYRDPSDLVLIEAMVTDLATMLRECDPIVLPRLGCGLGGLRWADVRPILAKHLDDRFVVVSPDPLPDARRAGTGEA